MRHHRNLTIPTGLTVLLMNLIVHDCNSTKLIMATIATIFFVRPLPQKMSLFVSFYRPSLMLQMHCIYTYTHTSRWTDRREKNRNFVFSSIYQHSAEKYAIQYENVHVKQKKKNKQNTKKNLVKSLHLHSVDPSIWFRQKQLFSY